MRSFGCENYRFKKILGGNTLNHKHLPIFFLALMLLLFNGCGSDQELEEYKSNMETFYSDISGYDSVINSIDSSSDTSVQELLAALDALEERFTWMASLSIPEEFSMIGTLADEAGEYMTNAVALYHQAYENTPFDADTAEIADEYYARANKRAVYILSILHGEIPESGNTENLEDSGE